jgi:hypothetical protein
VVTATIVAALLLMFATISYTASRGKSATYDEPLHLVGGFVHLHAFDFRLNPEDPALFGYWAALPLGRGEMRLFFDTPLWEKMPQDVSMTQWSYVMNTLYRTDGINPDRLIQKSRLMFVIAGVLLGAIIAWWSWQLGGAAAAIAATAFFAFDPNFLAHAALIKNDVFFALLMAVMVMGLWRFGQRGTWISLTAIAMSCALAANVKFSALLCGPIIVLTLLTRVLVPEPWTVLGKALTARWQRLLVVVAACAVVGLTTYAAIWACYGFRFSPSPDPAVSMNFKQLVTYVQRDRLFARGQVGQFIPWEAIEAEPPGLFTNLVVWTESHHLAPQAWLYGLLYTYMTTLTRGAYLMGNYSHVGWWYYFPFAVLFKTPTATLLAMLLCFVGAIVVLIKKPRPLANLWPAIAVAVPLVVYGISALTTNMNIGLRHVLPMYPLVFVAMGVVIARLIQQRQLAGIALTATLLLGLTVESLAAYPDFLAFFNAPSGGSRGGLSLLSDSNLDWGQDLILLGQWQKKHRSKPLYLNYFGIADPSYYGIVATTMPGGWRFDSDQRFPDPRESCYLAISATNLQGVFYNADRRAAYQQLLERKPLIVLGGTIYIYELPMEPLKD